MSAFVVMDRASLRSAHRSVDQNKTTPPSVEKSGDGAVESVVGQSKSTKTTTFKPAPGASAALAEPVRTKEPAQRNSPASSPPSQRWKSYDHVPAYLGSTDYDSDSDSDSDSETERRGHYTGWWSAGGPDYDGGMAGCGPVYLTQWWPAPDKPGDAHA